MFTVVLSSSLILQMAHHTCDPQAQVSTPNDKDDLISVYTRQDAINDGVLVDLMQGELERELEYHDNCEPVDLLEKIEWENVRELLLEAKADNVLCAGLINTELRLNDADMSTTHKHKEALEALQACQEYHQDREPVASFAKNDWRLFISELISLIDEIEEVIRVNALSTAIDNA